MPANDVASGWENALSVILPAYNEAEGIGVVLAGLREKLPQAEIIVVDDHSQDGTGAIAGAIAGVRVIRHPVNRGYGAALKTGMLAASRRYVAWIDADGEYSVEDLTAITRRIVVEERAAVLTQRRQRSPSLVRLVGKWVIRQLARSLEFDVGNDLNSGLRVFERDIILRYLAVLPDGFSASMTSTMVMFERGYDVVFHPIDSHARIGNSKVRIKDGFASLMLVLRIMMLFAPLRIFFRSGLLFMAAGFGYGLIRALVDGVGMTAAGVMAFITGVLLCMLGLIADQISQIRLGGFDALTASRALAETPARREPEPPQR